MAAQQTPSDSAGKSSSAAFDGLGSSLGFFQDWLKAAGSAFPNLQGSAAQAGVAPNWSMPTLDPEELDKRIQDLRTVQFWLEQNARMIAMTIQGLEVQKMTLSTLQGMNVSMEAVRDALRARTSEASAQPGKQTAAATDEVGAATEATAGQAELINPMRWWDTLTQQFTHLAAQTSQTAQSMGESMAATNQQPASEAATARKTATKASPRKKAPSPRSGSRAG